MSDVPAIRQEIPTREQLQALVDGFQRGFQLMVKAFAAAAQEAQAAERISHTRQPGNHQKPTNFKNHE
jgi:hypothetical protein